MRNVFQARKHRSAVLKDSKWHTFRAPSQIVDDIAFVPRL